ncbi:Secreted protein containing DUF1559 OS=Rhodopirellula sallentina SM41 GN=RSSM_03172 PE=4 SV=1: SBP_bac_10 [Gemmataceae bacterium]|nr:Secreted protein containing DUF1559 OS=Rhodopirellula sallentina SM41 GN=RSSM_03172 PE=4 SV=1: SBP_bac_10 [Gemmataceae bacterium]VTU02151.1 Secreted protein containing DUF1559 OS=Rhodopirellula sallentina SM41 GN=RSSM_03172 PE=4 SV=1: SBP_bac_10 [Gemmataceae bacterium]
MRFATRSLAVAALAGLAAAVVLFRPDAPPAAAAQPGPALPADLALVPPDAVGFVHVRAADLWKSDALAGFRQTFEKAGPKALAALDEQFVPKISTLDRMTAFLVPGGEGPPVPFGVLRFSAPFDPAEVVKVYAPGAEKVAVAGRDVFSAPGAALDLYFPDRQHIVVGTPGTFALLFADRKAQAGPMGYALKLAAAGKPFVAAVNLQAVPLPGRVLADLPPEAKALLKAEHVTLSASVGGAITLDLAAGYKTAGDAQDAEKAIKALAEYARKELAKLKDDLEKQLLGRKGPRPPGDLPEAVLTVFGLGALNQADEWLANPAAFVKRDGAMLTASVNVPKELVAVYGAGSVMVGLLLPAVQKVRGAAARMTSSNNLKQIAIAVHNYHDTYQRFPSDITDKNGKPLLSWRVAILPFLEQDALYKQFKLDEPWDSENNKKASQAVVKVYLSPQAPLANPAGLTHYRGFAGPGTAFEPGKQITLAAMADGTSNTLMVVETADAVEWAKPNDIPFDPKKPFPKLTSVTGDDKILAAMCDGSVRVLDLKRLTEATLKAAVTCNGGEILGKDWNE